MIIYVNFSTFNLNNCQTKTIVQFLCGFRFSWIQMQQNGTTFILLFFVAAKLELNVLIFNLALGVFSKLMLKAHFVPDGFHTQDMFVIGKEGIKLSYVIAPIIFIFDRHQMGKKWCFLVQNDNAHESESFLYRNI